MRPEQLPHAGMLIDDVMRRWPRTIRVLMRRRMLCIGCPIGIFHTVADACRAHEIDEDDLDPEVGSHAIKKIGSNRVSRFEPTSPSPNLESKAKRITPSPCASYVSSRPRRTAG